MKTYCSCCERWTLLPLDGGNGEKAHAYCDYCAAPLHLENQYPLCQSCGHYYLGNDNSCPLCHNTTRAGMVIDEVVVAYTTEAQTRKSRDGQYYQQLYIDYQTEAQPAPAITEQPSHPSAGNGHAAGALQNGTGTPAPDHALNGVEKGYGSNGSANGNGHAGMAAPASSIDLAVTETMPLTLFPQEEAVRAYEADIPATKASSAGNYNEFEYELIQDPSRLAEVAEMLAQETALGIDTETTGLDPHTSQLLLLQLSTADKVYVVDCKRLVPLAFKQILENNKILKVAQNAKFEYEMLKQQTGIVLNGVFDTMLAERIMTAGVGREISLKAIAQKYIGAILDKSVRESFYKRAAIDDAYLADEELHYAARDAYIMLPIWQQQLPELKKHKLMQIATLEFECIAAVGDMELAGVKIDEESWRKIIADVLVQRDKASVELCEILEPATMQTTMFGVPSINLNSNLQLIEAFSNLGVDLPDTMESTLVKYDHPAVKKLLEYRGHEKMLSAFGESVLSLINPKTGRIHPDFNQHGADTGRFSCVAGETLISATRGLKRVDSIQAGDFVQTSFGPREVLATWCNGVRPLVKVTLSDGRVLRLTADHKVLTGHGDDWRTVEELSPGDNVFLSLHQGEIGSFESPPTINIDPGAKYTKRKATIPQSLSVPLCELAGLITADGTFAENQSYRVVRGKRGIRYTSARYDRVVIDFGWDHDELIEKIKEYGILLFGISFTEHSHKTARKLTLASTQVSGALAKLGLSGTAHTKEVPEAILTAPALFQAAYLRGLFEGDGHITERADVVGLTSVNHRLLETVQTMLSFLGCNASIRNRNDSSGFSGAPRYNLGIAGGENLAHFMRVVGFMSSRKNNRASSICDKPLGSMTPINISGPKLYKEAVTHGLITPSRKTIKPFVQYYKNNCQRTTTLDKLIEKWADLPELEQAKSYRQRKLYSLQIASIDVDGTGLVYDLTVAGASEFLANGVVVHNCTKPNVQQIPATSDFRKCFVAPEGYKLVTCDYSQAELRILAELSGDEGFVTAFQSGGDLHALTASQMFGVPLEEVQKPQRNAAKAINFGLAYGMGPGGLAPRLGVTLDEAKELISRYFKAYPGVQKWLDKAAKDSVRLGYSVTTLGRKRFYNLPDESLKGINEDEYRKQISSIERQGKNSPIQGGNADMTKLALINIRNALKGWEARIVNTVHDEIVVEVRNDQAEEVKHIVEREMVKAGETILKSVPVVADASLADYWSK